jgi:hypothetical protein
MFLMTCRAGAVLDDVRFVKAVFLMTSLAFAIDRFYGDAVTKTIAYHLGKFPGGDVAVVTLGAVVPELCVTRRNFAGVKESFATVLLKKPDRDQSAKDREQTDNESRAPPGVKSAIITEIAFVTLGDLFLGAFGHFNSTQQLKPAKRAANLTALSSQA